MKNHCYLPLLCVVLLMSCGHSKPASVSDSTSKVAVADSGQKDSINNNSKHNYGNATASDPCIKCLLDVIKKSNSYQTIAGKMADSSLIYNVNWVKAAKPYRVENGGNITNGLLVEVIQKQGATNKALSSYIYNNADSSLYVINPHKNYQKDEMQVDHESLKKIRNACFWGVASR